MATKTNSAGHDRARRIEVLVVDDHPVVREGIIERVNASAGFNVCRHVNTAFEAQQALIKFRPDLIITELALPDRHGLEFVKDLRAQSADLRIVVFTASEESIFALRALRAGANGFVMKHEPLERLMEGLQLVAQGNYAVNPEVWTRFLSYPDQGASAGSDTVMYTKLTDRELEVFELIGKGAGTREIAGYLNRSVSTVETCRLSIKEKLGIRACTELACRAIRWVESRHGMGNSLSLENASASN